MGCNVRQYGLYLWDNTVLRPFPMSGTSMFQAFKYQCCISALGRIFPFRLRRRPEHAGYGPRHRKLIGIVSLGDLTTKHSADVDRTSSDISTPSEPHHS